MIDRQIEESNGPLTAGSWCVKNEKSGVDPNKYRYAFMGGDFPTAAMPVTLTSTCCFFVHGAIDHPFSGRSATEWHGFDAIQSPGWELNWLHVGPDAKDHGIGGGEPAPIRKDY